VPDQARILLWWDSWHPRGARTIPQTAGSL